MTSGNIAAALGYTPADAADVVEAQATADAALVVFAWGGGLKAHPFSGITSGVRVTLAPTNDRNWYLIGIPTGYVRVTAPSVEVNVGQAGANCRVGICEWNAAAGQPGPMVADWGTANCSSPGTKTFSNGAATADLNPAKAYAIIFNSGGGTAPTYYYQPFSPSGSGIFVAGTSMMVIAVFDAGESLQRINGFNSPPSVAAALSVETTSNAAGWRNFVLFNVSPTP